MSGSNSLPPSAAPANPAATNLARARNAGRLRMLLVMLACAAPVITSYVVFYGVRPEGRTNYGDLLTPQVALPGAQQLAVSNLEGAAIDMNQLRGNWLMLTTDSGSCEAACQQKLYWMRQLKTAQGREKTRIDRVLIASDAAPLPTVVMREFEGTLFLRAPAAHLAAWLPVPAAGSAQDHIYLMDPQGNVMLRWPKDADAGRIKRDLGKLLRASNAWQKEKPPRVDAAGQANPASAQPASVSPKQP